MRISLAARSALKKAISAHHGWDDLRRERGFSLATINKADTLEICDRLGISVETIIATTPDDDAATIAQEIAEAAVQNVRTVSPAAAADFPDDDAAAVAQVDLLPWSAEKLARFDKVISCVDEAASFSLIYHTAMAQQFRISELAMQVTELQNSTAPVAEVDLGAKASAPDFVAPSWSRDFADFVSIGATIAIVGPAGNGKTTAARRLLEADGFTVYEIDCTDATMPQDIIGRTTLRSVDGATVTEWTAGPLAKAFCDPRGALLLNEYDALDPRTGMALQSALEAGSTRRATSPDSGEQIRSSGPCPIVLTLNTIGHGATVQYAGRNALDGANRDRIEIIRTGYEHERAIMIAHGAEPETATVLEQWAASARAALAAMNSLEILSNRRLLTAAQLMDRRGYSLRDATDRAFTKRLDDHSQKEFARHHFAHI